MQEEAAAPPPAAGGGGGPASAPGARIGTWELSSRIGAGSFAVVWRARRADGEEAAVKEISTEKLSSKLRESLAQEVAVLQRTHHENIVRMLDVHKARRLTTPPRVAHAHTHAHAYAHVRDARARTRVHAPRARARLTPSRRRHHASPPNCARRRPAACTWCSSLSPAATCTGCCVARARCPRRTRAASCASWAPACRSCGATTSSTCAPLPAAGAAAAASR